MAKPKRPQKLKKYPLRPVPLIMLVAVLAFGFFNFVVPQRVESNEAPPLPNLLADETVLLPVPVREIKRGEPVVATDLVKIKWPKDRQTQHYLQSPEGLSGRVALTSLNPYVPIPNSAIGDSSGDSNAVVERIPEGMRAITVKVDLESAVEGWAQSGNYVDVVLLRQAAQAAEGMEAQVIAENVRILSAGRSAEPAAQSGAPRAPATVTLLVRQVDALKIKTAASIGRLTFSLRGLGDEAPTVARALSERQLLGGQTKQLPLKESLRGYAKGPDGRKYVLAKDDTWIPESKQAPRPEREPLTTEP